jgi:NADPH-dependent ferric siderophore reductase
MTKPITHLTVTASEQLSPDMLRLRFRSDDLSAFADSIHTDRYVKLLFHPDGGTDVSGLPEDVRPVMRSYTALDPDPAGGTLTIDFVVHGDTGVAGPWAAAARPGDTIAARGPGGDYVPSPAADWHLLAGDEAALPAIRQAAGALRPDAEGYAVVLVDGPGHEQPFPVPAGVRLRWLHRADDTHPGLADAVKALPWRDGRVHAFVHGEAQTVMHEIRPYLLRERSVPRPDVSISGYWREGLVDEDFRAWKKELAAAEGA